VVVFGAAGFTGRLVCEHIARDYQASDTLGTRPCPPPIGPAGASQRRRACPAFRRCAAPRLPPVWRAPHARRRRRRPQGKVRWAMAGRDRAKLERIRSELAKVNPAVEVRRGGARRKAEARRRPSVGARRGWQQHGRRPTAAARLARQKTAARLVRKARPRAGRPASTRDALNPLTCAAVAPAQAVPVIVADAMDYDSLAAMTQATRCVVNVAGPCEPRPRRAEAPARGPLGQSPAAAGPSRRRRGRGRALRDEARRRGACVPAPSPPPAGARHAPKKHPPQPPSPLAAAQPPPLPPIPHPPHPPPPRPQTPSTATRWWRRRSARARTTATSRVRSRALGPAAGGRAA
jgi:hypothetical protein